MRGDGGLIDYRGAKLLPGVTVAFNLSGTVAIGVIVSAECTKFTRTTWGYDARYDIRVKNLYPHPSKKVDGISRVRSPMNLVVLD